MQISPPLPMNINESIEAAKILVPYRKTLRDMDDQKAGLVVNALLKKAQENKTEADIMRLASYMFHKDVEALAQDMRDEPGVTLALMLLTGFGVNPLGTLLEFSTYLFVFDVE